MDAIKIEMIRALSALVLHSQGKTDEWLARGCVDSKGEAKKGKKEKGTTLLVTYIHHTEQKQNLN